MPTHNTECTTCGHQTPITNSPWLDNIPCPSCGGPLVILWTNSIQHSTIVNPKERIVVWEHPTTGAVRYPGRNDIPIPQRYLDQGFQRRELATRREAEQFERDHNVRNEKLWYNSGNSFD